MIRLGDIEDAFQVYQSIPEFQGRLCIEEFQQRVGNTYLALIYETGGADVAFKLGYPLGTRVFYSWLGGVLQGYRGQGIAEKLLKFQEVQVIKSGCTRLEVKSKNRFPAMMCLLLKNDYMINGLTINEVSLDTTIHFYKSLTTYSPSTIHI